MLTSWREIAVMEYEVDKVVVSLRESEKNIVNNEPMGTGKLTKRMMPIVIKPKAIGTIG